MFRALNLEAKRLIERFDPGLWLIRVLLAAMFIESGIDKIMHWSSYLAEVGAHHIPFPYLALLAAAVVELVGSAAVLTGFALTPALLALAAYTLILNFFYFDFWALPVADAVMARKEFLKNLAVAGGLLAYIVTTLRAHAAK